MIHSMIGFIFAAWLAGGPSPEGNPGVTVDQLRMLLVEASHEPDAEIAHRIASVHLSERLTAAELQHFDDALHPGPHSGEALRLLADSSAFLDPPRAEIPARAEPSIAEQQAMLNAAIHFVAVTLKRLPDFFATRTTQSFDDLPMEVTHSGWVPGGTLHADGTFSQEITFRHGKEVVGARQANGKPAILSGLTSTGEFGPLQAVILRDIAHGTMLWSHWETTPAGVVGVFQYKVPEEQSHYEVDYCCVRSYEGPTNYSPVPGGIANAYHGKPGYHGTLSIDPETGAIVRVTLEALLKGSDPITDGGVAIDYGLVTIEGDKSYICPVQSVAISETRSQIAGDFAPRMVKRINEVAFTDYHRFGATVQMVAPTGSRQE